MKGSAIIINTNIQKTPRGNGQDLEQGRFHLTWGRASLLQGLDCWALEQSAQGHCGHFVLPWRDSKSIQMQTQETCPRGPCCSKEVGTEDLQRPLLTLPIQRFRVQCENQCITLALWWPIIEVSAPNTLLGHLDVRVPKNFLSRLIHATSAICLFLLLIAEAARHSQAVNCNITNKLVGSRRVYEPAWITHYGVPYLSG